MLKYRDFFILNKKKFDIKLKICAQVWLKMGHRKRHIMYLIVAGSKPNTEEWFKKIFLENTKQLDGPNLLIFDGHSSQNSIHIVCLPPHLTHCLQPWDMGVFTHFKSTWRKIVQEPIFWNLRKQCLWFIRYQMQITWVDQEFLVKLDTESGTIVHDNVI